MTTPPLELLTVPSGDFIMGLGEDVAGSFRRFPNITPNPEAFLDQRPAHRQTVGAFVLQRAPLTNREYRAFVDAQGYTNLRFFAALLREQGSEAMRGIRKTLVDRSGRPGPSSWNDGRCVPGEDDHPVSGICFYEALACAAFYEARLPSEAEWEHAARHPDGRLLPFGNAPPGPRLANLADTGGRRTSAVDAHPDGRSALGFFDLAGNVSEWTSSLYAAYPGGRVREGFAPSALDRVTRGGSFRESVFGALTTSRFPLNPLSRLPGLGVRLARDG